MKKQTIFKKALAGLLSFVVAASGGALSVFAAGPTKDGMIDEEYDFKYITKGYTDDGRTTTTKSHPALIRTLREAYMNFETSIDVSAWKLSTTEMNGITIIVRSVYPELFFIEGNYWDYEGDGDNSVVTTLRPIYIYTNDDGTPDKAKIKADMKAFYAEADRYLALVKGKLSACRDDFSKVLLLHDEMALDFRYAYDKRDAENNGDDVLFTEFNDYEMMINKDGVCRHYSEVYAYVLGQLGIQTEIISTPDSSKKDKQGRAGLNHEWIKVKLDGSWYHVDLTWDDCDEDEKPVKGQVWHDNFLYSDAAFEKAGHYGFKTVNPADNTKYDNANFHQYVGKCCKIDPDDTLIYAVKWESQPDDTNNEYRKNCYIVSYDYLTGEETKLMDLSEYKWKSKEIDGGNIVKLYPQTGLDSYGSLLFYNTDRKILCYDTRTNKEVEVSHILDKYDGQIFGLRIIDGELKYYYGEADKQTGKYIRSKTEEYTSKYYSDYAVPAESVSLNKTTVSTGVNSVIDLKAELTPANAADFVCWESSDPSVASVDKTGRVTANKVGKATIKVRTLPNNKIATCRVIVNNGPSSVSLNKTSAVVYKGKTLQLKATVSPDTSKSKKVIWSSTAPTIASVDSTGKVTALKAGEATITATTALNARVATCKVTVAVNATKIKLNKTSLSMSKGGTAQLTATVYPSNAYNKTVTWKSTNGLVASVDQTGKVTAKGAGTAKIKAKTANGIIAVCTVNVTIPVTKIVLNKSTANINKGSSIQLKATVYPSNAADKTVTWKSLSPKIASVDQTGKVTALAKGTAVIKAKAKNGVSAICTVTVKLPATAVKLNKTSATMRAGETLTLTASLVPSASTDSITWSSLNKSVATVSSSGVVTAVAPGTATISAKSASGKYAYCKITVEKNMAKKIWFDPTVYNTYTYCRFCVSDMLNYSPENCNDDKFSYSVSSNLITLSVGENNNIYAETGGYTGTVVITVTTAKGLSATLTVKISAQKSGSTEFDTKTGKLRYSTANGRADIYIGSVSTSVYGGESKTITYNGYKYFIEVFDDGSGRVTETAPNGTAVVYKINNT